MIEAPAFPDDPEPAPMAPATPAAPAGVPAHAADPADALLWEHARDVYFAGGAWAAQLPAPGAAPSLPEDSVPVVHPSAGAALALALGGWWGAGLATTRARERQRLLIDRI